MGDIYFVKYKCRNCYKGALVRIPYKQEAPNYFSCPSCGLKELWKTDKDIEWIFVYDAKDGELVKRNA
jgi:DNA-directed RNA polymerase subunit RPC12/RpoP